ncbi:hypothetical protein A1D22_09390 [Pasteurellaceae bacterium LFhippo2]|nr:hypothetical protein [Pasteurellaceae bacterium LFhippo2]
MKTRLRLPDVDKALEKFIKSQDDGLFIGSKFTVGIKYFGFIYREIYCEEPQELHDLENYLIQTGFFIQLPAPKGFDRLYELID